LKFNPTSLILVEPSNDLDIDTLDVLEEFLHKYTGILMLVSHDRYLIDTLSDQVCICEDKCKLTIYNGNYAEYKLEEEQTSRKEKERERSKQIEKSYPTVQTEKKKLSCKEQLEYESLENEITEIENTIIKKTETLNIISDHQEITAIAL